ncbi:sensor histidine kinase [Mitsuokella sp. WILCCON 0060]|uniref:sensor histidine kinase n=1 Tax=Mitsuokella sp. WILCCON 0060 TaxID=3345341 RepID=UPI003F1C164B
MFDPRSAKWNSVQWKVAGSTFLLLAFTVCSLIFLTQHQMEAAFGDYLSLHLAVMEHGAAEMVFIHSVHQSLWWVGLFFILLGFLISSLIGASITRPLRRLTAAAEEVRHGHFDQRVKVTSADEVGRLAEVFNQMAAELEKSEATRRDFFASITHELRTPLAVLQGSLENMTNGVSEPTPERLFAMQEEVMRLSRLVTDLRDLSLAEVHELKLHIKKVDLGQLASQMVMLMQPLFEEKQQELRCEIPKKSLLLHLDADRMRQVIGNLLINAGRHTPNGSHIVLALSETSEEILLTVTDDGEGIAKDELPHIFDKFYRSSRNAQSETNSPAGGSGIGLALARQYVEIQHGTITVSSSAEGTSFVIHLPKSLKSE